MGRGSSKAGGISTAGVTTAQTKTISKIANRTRNLKNEQYRVVNEDGEVVLTKQGVKGTVATTVGEKREFLEGAATIHNHPDGGTFSEADIHDFGYGARQITVASPEGTYTLKNDKYGTMDQYKGWRPMLDAMDKAGITKEVSYVDLRKQAENSPKIKKLRKESNNIANEWLKQRNAGASAETLQALYKKSDDVGAKLTKAVKDEVRRLETKPYDDFYKKNAKKYGFTYSFEKKG